MINEKSLEAVASSVFDGYFCKPLYTSYCFSSIPATIKTLFNPSQLEKGRLPPETILNKEYEHVILFLLDGFGWSFFKQYEEKYPFLKRIKEQGIVNQLTAQFPSTTAAHVTCINTGLTPGQSGIYEWFYYEPQVDCVIAPLLFSFARDKKLGTLHEALQELGVKAQDLFPKHTLYQDLEEQSVHSYVFLEKSIASSPYSQAMCAGAKLSPYSHLKDGLEELVNIQKKEKGKKTYFYFYFGNIDSAGHRHGIHSSEFEAEIEACFQQLEEHFYQCQLHDHRTALLLVADHGMTTIDPHATFYLNKELPECTQWLKRNRSGELIVPAGSCRDFFLHVEEAFLEEAKRRLEEILAGKAVVYRIEELIRAGFFGAETPSSAFLERVGNLVILPLGTHCVWWYEKHHFDVHFHAMHGGLSREEMEIPFLFLDI